MRNSRGEEAGLAGSYGTLSLSAPCPSRCDSSSAGCAAFAARYFLSASCEDGARFVSSSLSRTGSAGCALVR